jgi:hypothetical protein
MRHTIGTGFYILAGIATIYMYAGFVITIIGDIRQDGFAVTFLEHSAFGPIGLAIQFLLWSLPGLFLWAIGAWLRKEG